MHLLHLRFFPQGIDQSFWSDPLLRHNGVSVPDYPKITWRQLSYSVQIIFMVLIQSRCRKRFKEFPVENEISLRLQTVKSDFVVKTPDRGAVQFCHPVRGANKNPLIPLHARQKFIDKAYLPGTLSHFPVEQKRVRFVKYQNRLLPLRLGKGIFDFFSVSPT